MGVINVKISTIKMQKLQASEGMVLTNGEAYTSVGGYVYLPGDADASRWYEITEERYNEIMAEREMLADYNEEGESLWT